MGVDESTIAPIEQALHWAKNGWRVFPCIEAGDDWKAPYTKNGFLQATKDEAQIRAWWTRHPGALVGGATGTDSYHVVDLDVKHGIDGVGHWLVLAADAGLIPEPTGVVTTPSGGQHHWYRGLTAGTKNAQWPWFGLDLKTTGGYVILPGSAGYELIFHDLEIHTSLDWPLIEKALKSDYPVTRALWEQKLIDDELARQARARRSAARRSESAANTPQQAQRIGRLFAPLTGDGGGRPAEEQECYDAVCDWSDELNDVPVGCGWPEINRICSLAGSRVVRNRQLDEATVVHIFTSRLNWTWKRDGDRHRVERQIAEQVAWGATHGRGEPWRTGRSSTGAPSASPVVPPVPTPVAIPTAIPAAVVVAPSRSLGNELQTMAKGILPPEFYEGSPELEHIRTAAWSRNVSPTAVVMAVLTRLAARMDHRLQLPPLVGGAINLSFYSVLVGKVGGGKSGAARLAMELLGPPDVEGGETPEVIEMEGTGSGESLLQKMLVKDEDENAPKGAMVQGYHNLFWYVDEGKSLRAEKGRDTSTLMTVLCSAYFGNGLGNNAATTERNRRIDPMSYQFGVLISVQPENAGVLLEEQTTGLTQRCFWANADDTDIVPWRDRKKYPGPIPRQDANPDLRTDLYGKEHRAQIVLPTWYYEELMDRIDEKRGQKGGSNLWAHEIPMEEKLAATLASLRGAIDPNEDDIRRAKIAMDMHRGFLTWVDRNARLAGLKVQAVEKETRANEIETRAYRKLINYGNKYGEVPRKKLVAVVGAFSRSGLDKDGREAVMVQAVDLGLLTPVEVNPVDGVVGRWVVGPEAANWQQSNPEN